MGLIRRIENGTTTTKDADEVRGLVRSGVSRLIIGIGIGIAIMALIFGIFGS